MHTNQSILLITNNPLSDVKKHFDIDGAHPNIDTLIITPEPTIGIESIRNLQVFSNHRPLKSASKQIIILSAHLLTIPAQNALLKLLEEPPQYLTIIMTAPHTHAFLETILSRCVIVRSHPEKAAKSVDEVESSSLTVICSLTPPERLKSIPLDIKVRPSAITFTQQLIHQAEIELHQAPTRKNVENLQILTDCLSQLVANANATLAVTDAVLRLACR